jgi:biopolymer transport protein ExbD
MNFGGKIGAQKPPFPMTAMIDILFLMLVFFITTQIYAQFEAELSIEVPKSSAAEPIERDPLEVIINISADGKYIINQIERPLSREDKTKGVESIREVLLRLSSAFRKEGLRPHVIIRASKETKYDNVIQVLTECKNAGIENVSFAVIEVEKEEETD